MSASEAGLSARGRPGRALPALLLAVLLTTSGCARQSEQANPPSPAPSPAQTPSSAPAATQGIPNLGHIFIILMENKSLAELIGSPQAPYINRLAETYAYAGEYYAIRHPSLPNYLALASGSTQGITTDCPTCTVNAPNLVDQLEAWQKSWAAYMEDMPQPCFNGAYAGGPLAVLGLSGYARKHNPWIYFDNIRNNPARCERIVPLTELAPALKQGQLPDYVWITPNQKHDMHNGSVEDGDKWLASFVPAILASPAWQNNGVLFIIWDEGTTNAGCCGDASGGQTLALVIAAQGKRGYRSATPYTHYSVLRTIEEAWQLGYLGGALDPGTQAMSDFFR